MRKHIIIAIGLVFWAWFAKPAVSQTQIPIPKAEEGITVQGVGETTVKPTTVEIDVKIVGSAELTGDALVKYRDSKKRVQEAFDKLKMKELALEYADVSVVHNDPTAQNRYYGGMPNNNTVKAKSDIGTTIKLKWKLEKDSKDEKVMEMIGKLLDVARDAGALVGPSANDQFEAMRYGRMMTSSLARFTVDDYLDQREKAYEQAVLDAKTRAERLAKLNGVKLGAVVSVQEIAVSDEPAMNFSPYYGLIAGAKGDVGPKLTSEKLGAIPLRVKLQVRYAIEKTDGKTAQK